MAATGSRAGSRERRRVRIEQTALELFRERGFDLVTVEDVCAAAACDRNSKTTQTCRWFVTRR